MNTPEGQVFDLGYRHYDGPREGRGRARRALFVNGIRTCFGLGRGNWAKVLPILFLVSVMAPAAVMAVMAGLLGEVLVDMLDLPGPQDYYELASPILLVFAAIIAPELLCPDRQNGVINLYLVRPLSSNDYVLSRWTAFFVVSLVFIYAGQVVLLAGLTMGSEQPLDYMRENWADVPRFLAAGLAIAAVTTTIPLAAASLTTRRAYASLAVIALFLVSTAVWAILSDTVSGEVGRWAKLIDFGGIPIQISDLIFDEYTSQEDVTRLPAAVAVAWWAVVVAAPMAILWSRYRRLVT